MYFTLSFGCIFSSICQYWGYILEQNAYFGFLGETGFSVSSRSFSLQNMWILVCYGDGEMLVAVTEFVFQQVKKKLKGCTYMATFELL